MNISGAQKPTITSVCVAFLLITGLSYFLQSIAELLYPTVIDAVNYLGDRFDRYNLHWQKHPIHWGMEADQIFLSVVALTVAILIGRRLLAPHSDQKLGR
jgi:hypothetical protein